MDGRSGSYLKSRTWVFLFHHKIHGVKKMIEVMNNVIKSCMVIKQVNLLRCNADVYPNEGKSLNLKSTSGNAFYKACVHKTL